MKLVNSITFEIELEERKYRLEMPAGAPLGEAYIATSKFMDKVVQLINEHNEKIQPQETEIEKEEEE